MAYRSVQWRRLLSCGSLFPDDSSSCPADKNTNPHRDFAAFLRHTYLLYIYCGERLANSTSHSTCCPWSPNFCTGLVAETCLQRLVCATPVASWSQETPASFSQPHIHPFYGRRVASSSNCCDVFDVLHLLCRSLPCVLHRSLSSLHSLGFLSALPMKSPLFLSAIAVAVWCCLNTFHIGHHGSLCS